MLLVDYELYFELPITIRAIDVLLAAVILSVLLRHYMMYYTLPLY
jgi:hypothetical protein